jgi:BON domain
MDSRIPYALAALLVAGAALHAPAQETAADPADEAPTVPYVPAWIPKAQAAGPEFNFVPEPPASASRTNGLDGELAASIAQSISADPAMKNAKITVLPDDGGTIVLTGTALNRAQAQRAAEIATAHAGAGTVVNAIVDAAA